MTDDYGLKNLQEHPLEILIDIDRVCRDNGINYSLCGDTLLGEIRHKGLIPWDDDVDICLQRDDYKSL